MNNTKILSGLLGCLLCLLTGCSNEFEIPSPRPGEATVEVTITTGELTKTEPGVDVLNENKIETIDLFFCQGGATVFWYVESQYLRVSDIDGFTKRLIISIPTDKIAAMNGSTYDLYAVINGPARAAMTGITSFNTLQTIVFESTELNQSTTAPLGKFLMTGVVSTGLLQTGDTHTISNNLELKRTAAKIRLHLEPIDVDGYTMIGQPQIRLVHYADRTSLLPGAPISAGTSFGYKDTPYTTMVQLLNDDTVLEGDIPPSPNLKEYTTKLPYYAYENDWSVQGVKETFMYLKIKLRLDGTSIDVDFYYRVPLSTRLLPGSTLVERNMLYDITVKIGKVGSSEESIPTELEGYVAVKPWPVLSPIDGNVLKALYLVVKEKEVIMPNISYRVIEYITNLPAVQIENISANYTGYDTDGQPVPTVVTAPNLPNVTLLDSIGKTFVRIKSPIPKNYVPLYIEFDVADVGGQISEHVSVVQYPPRYVTARIGYYRQDFYQGHETGPTNITTPTQPAHTNFNLFRVTTIVNTPDIKLPTNLECFIGDPATGTNGSTGTDAATNRLISPDFIIASQNGVTPVRLYSNTGNPEGAIQRCRNYYEQIYGPGRSRGGRWRLPTRAEIQYIDDLQDDSNSAVKNLLRGIAYWSAQTYYYYNFEGNNPGYWSSGYSYSVAYIRCVFDVYKVE